jgi:hypothetical protein
VKAYKLSWLDEIKLWWEMHGELQADVVTYYGLCAAYGAYSGYWLGCEIARALG